MSEFRDRYAKYIIVLAPIAWGLNPSFMKIAYKYMNPLVMNFTRIMLALAFFIVFSIVKGRISLNTIMRTAGDIKLLMTIFVVFQVFYSVGISNVTASITGIIFGMLPVTIVIINIITGDEKINNKMMASIFLSIAGALIIVMSGNNSVREVSFIGMLQVFISQIAYGFFTVESKKKMKEHDPVLVTTVAMVPSVLVFYMLTFRDIAIFSYATIPLEGWIGIIFSGVFGMGLANAIWMWGAGKIGSTKISLYNNLNPVAALTGAFIMLGERMNMQQYIGVAVILAAIILSQCQLNSLKLKCMKIFNTGND